MPGNPVLCLDTINPDTCYFNSILKDFYLGENDPF